MKNYFNRLFCINTYFRVHYAFSSQNGLYCLTDTKEKRSIANICLLERDAYWQAERHYNNINIIDLPKLIKAEVAIIAPFPGRVFWNIKKLSTNQALVVYIVVPIEHIEAIADKCHFVYPRDFNSPSLSYASTKDLDINLHFGSASQPISACTIENINKKNIFSLAGFYLTKSTNETFKAQRLSLKQLILVGCASIMVFALISSAYLSFNLGYVEDKLASNRGAVEKALKIQRELKVKFESKKDFEQFSQENKNVLAIFSHVNFKNEKYRIDRVHLHPKGFKITGTSETSATNLLTILLNYPGISEAKFERAISKNRAGEDVFVIEVLFS